MLPWKAISNSVADLFIPPLCLNCQSRMEDVSNVICDNCLALIVPVGDSLCPKCGTPMDEEHCPACEDTDFRFSFARAPWMFTGPVQMMVHKLKYELYMSPVHFLARGMHTAFLSEPQYSNAEVITCVPLHRTRRRERTFNQSELLGRALSLLTGIAYEEMLLRRYFTHSQTKLTRSERRQNLNGAFSIRSNVSVKGRKVLLVDDVFTTGSTVNEASGALIDAGAAEVMVLTAARAG